jgi:hypothetical protein
MGLRPTQGDEKMPRSSNHSLWNRCSFLCHPERTRISYFTALTSATYVVLSKENHMQLTEAATLDRKSGKPRDLQFLFSSHADSSGRRQALQISARLGMIGRELQGMKEIVTCFRNSACSRLQHSQIVPVVGVGGAQMKCCFSFCNRLL